MTSTGTTETQGLERRPHAALDRETRLAKARKILALIGEQRFRSAERILEVGCGSGVITSMLSRLGRDGVSVHAVDVVDTRIDRTGYEFQLVSGTTLPYADATFDIVISNHVIEHVGTAEDQIHHLRELHRAVSPGGVVYLAVPNRWRLIEPHFHLPFLSWLPRSLGDRYVRATGKGTHYDCDPPSYRQITKLFRSANFEFEDKTIQAVRETLRSERPGALSRFIGRVLPHWVSRLLMPVMPTYIFMLTVRDTD